MKNIFTFSLLAIALQVNAQPELYSWMLNTNNSTGYGNIPSNILQLHFSAANIYVGCDCIPGYDIGPWAGNPNVPSNQNFVFKITRTPVKNTGTLVSTPLGHIGVFTNGVSIFNALDAFSYNNQNVWHQDAVPNEGSSFDACLGHPAPNGEYHNHINPTCLYDDSVTTLHSPIIGWAFDGFPIYGAYSYADTNGTGPITRMKSSYRLRNITQRTTLPDGTVLSAPQYGPAVSASYPLGTYIEDYEYVPGLGHLDEHNGRFCVTPDYPAGIYAYFVTIDSLFQPAYPYTLGPTYYGTVQAGNTGPGSGHNTITETVLDYMSVNEAEYDVEFDCFPNPTRDVLNLYIGAAQTQKVRFSVTDISGKYMMQDETMSTGKLYNLNVSSYPAGYYFATLEINGVKVVRKFVKE